MFEKIKKFYNLGLYTKDQVKMFYIKGKITETEYLQIIGSSTQLS